MDTVKELSYKPNEWSEPRTQKAKGYKAIYSLEPYGWRVPDAYLIQSDEDLDYFISFGCREVFDFARPCPTVPRHGFVESGPVKSDDELKEVWRQTKEADPEGEMLMLKTIDEAGHHGVVA